MYNSAEVTKEVTTYLNKLKRAVNCDAKAFEFCNILLLNKSRIDDIICCIEASIPKKFKEYVKHSKQEDVQKIKTNILFDELKKLVQRKFFLRKDLYITNSGRVIVCINNLLKVLEYDLEYVRKILN